MEIDQILLLSLRGDILIHKCFGEHPDTMHLDAIHASIFDLDVGEKQVAVRERTLKIVKDGALLAAVVTNRDHDTDLYILTWLDRFSRCIQDALGNISEEGIRENQVLVYEIIETMLNGQGQPVLSDIEIMKRSIFSKPDTVKKQNKWSDMIYETLSSSLRGYSGGSTVPARTSHRPLIGPPAARSEVFLDIIENLYIDLNSKGYPNLLFAVGDVTVKSFLVQAENKQLEIMFTNELDVAGWSDVKLPGHLTKNKNPVFLDHVTFEDPKLQTNFQQTGILSLPPPLGEKRLMTYRTQHGITVPFSIVSTIKELTKSLLIFDVNIQPKFKHPLYAASISGQIEIPKEIIDASVNISSSGPQNTNVNRYSYEGDSLWNKNTVEVYCDFERHLGAIGFKISRMQCSDSATLTITLTLPFQVTKDRLDYIKQAVGPLKMSFDLPMTVTSGVKVHQLRVIDTATGVALDDSNVGPNHQVYRWIRYITHTDSYVHDIEL